jgi:hypothetical protein
MELSFNTNALTSDNRLGIFDYSPGSVLLKDLGNAAERVPESMRKGRHVSLADLDTVVRDARQRAPQEVVDRLARADQALNDVATRGADAETFRDNVVKTSLYGGGGLLLLSLAPGLGLLALLGFVGVVAAFAWNSFTEPKESRQFDREGRAASEEYKNALADLMSHHTHWQTQRSAAPTSHVQLPPPALGE